VLALSVTTHLYPRLEAEHFGAGRLTKIRAQAVSGAACRAVAAQLGLPQLLRAAAPAQTPAAAAVVETDRVLASVLEAVIGAVYLTAGFELTSAAVVEAFAEQIDEALENPVDFKSALQERLACRGETVVYEVTAQAGPPHDRTFSVAARVGESIVARGMGRSKKLAEQDAARSAIETPPGSDDWRTAPE
jgi:ribonuclease-3